MNSLTINHTGEVLELNSIHLSQANKLELQQLLKEFKYIKTLEEYKLPVANKLLLFGHTGCGKTTTARAIAKKLNKKIVTLNLGGIIDSRLGQSAKNITEVFTKANRGNSVLFLDEFDSIGKTRNDEAKDSGEIKRLVNTVIQLIDQLPNDTLLVAATNNLSIIDTAILRRFQLRLEFKKPTNIQLDSFYDSLLEQYPEKFRTISRKYNFSYAEAKDYIFKSVKNNIIANEEKKLNQLETNLV